MTEPHSSPDSISVVIVDDQTLVRQGIRSLLSIAEIEVLGEAADGREAVDEIKRCSPDVVLLDLRMPGFDGMWTLDQLRKQGIDVPVLVLTTFDDDALVIEALRAGARGYLLKDVTVERLTWAVSALAGGGTIVAPSITDRLLTAIRASETPPDLSGPMKDLSERELEVLRLMAAGLNNREIADSLYLAEGTAKNHVSSILLKLSARDRTQAVLKALHQGILG